MGKYAVFVNNRRNVLFKIIKPPWICFVSPLLYYKHADVLPCLNATLLDWFFDCSAGSYHILLIVADGQVTRGQDLPETMFSRQEQETMQAIVEARSAP